MALRVYNTLARKKEDFVPLKPGEVKMYVCGVTVYDLCHIGHARSMIVFDTLYRYLRFLGFKVKYVRNFTDLDDKIIARAQKEGTSPSQVAERFIKEFYEDMAPLGLLPPTVEPRATEHIQEMIEMVKTLISKGHAYQVGNDVYFSVESFPSYGKLSGRNWEEMMAGARVQVDERKRNPLDFALWKGAKPGEPSWESPWGRGRPGWHLECSVMSQKYLGETFDIHGGGQDLIFPHHENEIAQSEAATGRPFVRYWLHNGFVNIKGEKMSKSLGNILTLKELWRRYEPEALRLFLLSRHYRSPIDFSPEALQEEEKALERLYQLAFVAQEDRGGSPARWKETEGIVEELPYRFREAMDDDLNTPRALSLLYELARKVNKVRGQGERMPQPLAERLREGLGEIGEVLGILREQPSSFLKRRRQRGIEELPISLEELQGLIAERTAARKRRDFQKADEIRSHLASLGIILEDTPQGTTWRIKH